ncbi:MAG: response regulator [Verrucomicrobia bacterium]|nr:response regulator [Verrucomicrobiota bacterium]
MSNDATDTQILLAEDDPHDAELTMRVLKKRNLADNLVWAQDGVAALDFVFGADYQPGGDLRHKPKLVLLDVKMPKLNGIQVLERLKSDAAAKIIPVVMLTSSREERDLLRCYELGVNSYIVKPVAFETFTEAVTQVGLYWMLRNEQPRH